MDSTLTFVGKFSNILFNEEKLFKEMKIPTKNILKIGCNYGELINENLIYKEHTSNVRTSNTGRNPKIKEASKKN